MIVGCPVVATLLLYFLIFLFAAALWMAHSLRALSDVKAQNSGTEASFENVAFYTV